MTAIPKERAQEYTLSSSEFNFICNFVYQEAGIVLDERKREMVYRRLMRRTRELKTPSFSAYCQLLQQGDGDEARNFINAITTNLTSFFREQHHFDYLADTFFPAYKKANSASRLRIWSAGCSTGEEPYSIAITLMQTLGMDLSPWDVKILATDLDSDVIAKADRGVYDIDRIQALPYDIKHQWFYKGKGDNEDQVKVSEKLQQLITFKQLNLLQPWPLQGPFDVIFCRNVIIYFDKPTQEKLIRRLLDLLRPGGVLFLGHSENINICRQSFKTLGRTSYLKLDKNMTEAAV